MNPLLLDIPFELETERLRLRVPRAGDGKMLAESVRESLAELKVWMPWATDDYGETQAEEWVRRAAANFLTREQLQFLILLKESQTHIGTFGAFRFEWSIMRCEIGYWLRTPYTGKGYMTEAVNGLVQFCEKALAARRIEIRCDDGNGPSGRVAERCGFALEGVLQHESRDALGRLRNTRIYAKTRGD
ncbi:MAG TPA: GNAT family N-acetyltransferase [Tepidisphaeraceae bacterium]|jgi:RimJ/RimL family protein N-acetyltransferase